MMEAGDNHSKTLAILAMLLSEWPSCMLGYNVTSVPNPPQEGLPDDFRYTNHNVNAASLIHVAGPRRLNFVLPSYIADVSGRSQSLTTPRWQILSGPEDTLALPANTPLQYCGRGDLPNDHFVPLTDFLVSWIPQIKADDVMKVLTELNKVMPMELALAAMRDVANVACYLYPKLVLGEFGIYPQPCRTRESQFSTHALMDYTSGSGLSPHQLSGDFPTMETFHGDFIINAFDFVAWNQVVLSLAHVDIPDHVRMPEIRAEYAHKPVLSSNVARSLMLSSCWQIMLQYQGATCQTWLTHRTCMNGNWIPRVLPLVYGGVSQTTEESLAPAGYQYSNLMWALSGNRPTTVRWTFEDGSVRPVTVFDRMCWTDGVATVYDDQGVEYTGYIPMVLVDAWLLFAAKWLPQGWVPFPPPAKRETAKTFFKVAGVVSTWELITIDDVIYETSLFLGQYNEFYPPASIWREEDLERWNKRLFLSSGLPFKIVNRRGIPPVGVVGNGKLPWARINFLRGDSEYPIEQLGQSTLCVSQYDERSQRIFVVLPRDQAEAINTTWAGSGFCNRACWLQEGIHIAKLEMYEVEVRDNWRDRTLQAVAGFRSVKSVKEAQGSPGVQDAPGSAELDTLTKSTPQSKGTEPVE
nr:MAG: capsid protein [Ilomantsi toti-like virus 2]